MLVKIFPWRHSRHQTLTPHSSIPFHDVTQPTLFCISRFLSQSQSQNEDTYDPPFSFTSKTLKPNNENKEKKQGNSQNKTSLKSEKDLDFPLKSNLPFDFGYSYSETNPLIKPIGYREPLRFSPFGLGRLDWKSTDPCAPAKEAIDLLKLEERREVLGEPLSKEVAALVERFRKGGVTHYMLEDIHNHRKQAEAVKIKCMGVPTLDTDNVCFQLEDKSGGNIIYRHINILLLYQGRNYDFKKRPVIPLMLWKPYAPIYPKLVKNVADGLTFEEKKEMRNRGLNFYPLMKLTRNGVYVNVVERVREAFQTEEVVRLDCTHVGSSDCKKIGVKLRDLVPCVPILFKDDQIILWRGKEELERDSSSLIEPTTYAR
ncbi:hypothetical protein HYC85_011663 [Camellia sinensis]|uniref:CRM domain-containing protein n=1 Tax=Camellia sinensis TaxID=4442 RepID=A0A7J7H9P8_CAMSI|nr:hypothetical protein HYC85_011663 [Camellia sinensis]